MDVNKTEHHDFLIIFGKKVNLIATTCYNIGIEATKDDKTKAVECFKFT